MKTNFVLLAVDDMPSNLFVLKELVDEYLPQCSLVTARSAEEGLALATEQSFDGVLVDVQMPEVDGLEMCRRLKADERTSQLPVVLMTAHSSTSELRARGLEAGADDFISRPIDNVELVAKIRVMLRIKRADDELRDMNARLEDMVAERTGALRRIEWLLTKSIGDYEGLREQSYGDLPKLGVSRLLLDSVGEDILLDCAADFLNLLGTSAAIVERNGDYALRIFSSKWCQLLNRGSRDMCGAITNGEALRCGKWRCHESCWHRGAKIAIETGQPVDFECPCIIRSYVVPIFAGERVVGAISVAYGDPPYEVAKLRRVSQEYGIPVNELQEAAESYESRPHYIVEVAKDRVKTSAKLIGEIVRRHEAEERLRQSEAKYVDLYVNAPDMFGSVDAETGVLIECNQALADNLGYVKHEIIGMSLVEIHHPECWEAAQAAFESFVTTGEVRDAELQLMRKDGSAIDVLLNVSAVRDETGRITHSRSVWRDITERRKIEWELSRAKEAAEAANRAKSAFLANMSHEIRTPMTAVMGYAELLMEDDPPTDERREYLRAIHDHSESLLTILNDILDLAKIEAEKIEVQRTDCSPIEIAERVKSLLEVRAEQKSLSLDVICEYPLPKTVRTDPLRLRQILANLAGNAVKFTDTGGVKIVIRRSSQEDGTPCLQFDVVDTGIGISPEDVEQLFGPFVQVEESADRRAAGVGLGLSLSLRLAKLLGGGIDVKSEPGKGSTFTLTIDPGPLADTVTIGSPKELIADEGAPVKESGPEEAHGRILLVEDEPDIQLAFARFLREAGNEVEIADNGQVAFEKALESRAKGEPYDVILMDIRMPVMDGYEATRRLRQEGWQGVIVAQTAHTLTGDREKCLEAGCDDYIAKPLTREELLESVARHLSKPPAAATS